MGAIFVSLEMNHTIQTGERCATALIAMRIEFFLGEDVAAGLEIMRSALSSSLLGRALLGVSGA